MGIAVSRNTPFDGKIRQICFWFLTGTDELRLLAITVATDETDGYKRFMRSAKVNNIDVKVFLNYSCVFPFCGLLG